MAGRITQVTATAGGINDSPSIDAVGTRIAFRSNNDLAPGNPGNADGSFEIFRCETSALHAPGGGFTQITSTVGPAGSFGPAVSGRGTRFDAVRSRPRRV